MKNFLLVVVFSVLILISVNVNAQEIIPENIINTAYIDMEMTARDIGGNNTFEILYDNNNEPRFILATSEQGYLIYDTELKIVAEWSAGGSPYAEYGDSVKHYGGPMCYSVESNSDYINPVTGEETEDIPYIRTIDTLTAKEIVERSAIISNNEIQNPLIMSNVEIPKYREYILQKAFGHNQDGTCTAIATQIILNYFDQMNSQLNLIDSNKKSENLSGKSLHNYDGSLKYVNAERFHQFLVNDCDIHDRSWVWDAKEGIDSYRGINNNIKNTEISMQWYVVNNDLISTICSEINDDRPVLVSIIGGDTYFNNENGESVGAQSPTNHSIAVYGYRNATNTEMQIFTYEFRAHSGWANSWIEEKNTGGSTIYQQKDLWVSPFYFHSYATFSFTTELMDLTMPQLSVRALTATSNGLNWSAVDNAKYYKILRKAQGASGYVQIGSTTSTEWYDNVAGSGRNYYQVIACKDVYGDTLQGAPSMGISASYGGTTNVINGTASNDSLNGTSDIDVIYGLGGNDTLYGNDGDDTLHGGAGNDSLSGGNDNDTYVFGTGFGNDVINDGNGINHIIFPSGVTAGDLSIVRYSSSSNDLLISIAGTSDTIRLSNAYGTAEYRNFDFEFFNGTFYHIGSSNHPFRNMYGTENNDIMRAMFSGTTIHAKGGADTLYGSVYADKTYGGAGNDYIYGGDGGDYLYGENDNDTLYGENGNDTLNGGAGNDNLYGENGNDTLNGGAGNDSLCGENGNDRYIFDAGFGTDVISDSQGTNRIVFTGDVTSEDLSIVRDTSSTNDLRIIVEGCNDTIRLRYANSTPVYRNFEFEFANGTIYTVDSPDNPLRNMYGTEGNDVMYALFEGTTIHAKGGADYLYGNSYTDNIYGGAGVDYIYGYGGADNLYGENDGDTLYGGEGDDTLNGGAGNDSLCGENGNDRYIFDAGFGTDVISDSQGTNRIVFTGDVTSEDLSIVRDTSSTNDLRIIVEGCNDTIRLRYANSTPVYRNFEFEFANGTIYTVDSPDNPLRNMYGTEGNDVMYALFEGTTIHAKGGADYLYGNSYTDNIYGGAGVDYIYGYGGADNLYGENDGDTLYGGEGDDTLNGGAGNDSLCGENGNDRYIFDAGFGTDVISDSQGTNRIVFTGDVTSEDLSIVRDTSSTNDLRIIVEGCNDTIRLRYANSTPVYRNFEFEFANGTIYTVDSPDNPLRNMYGTEGNDVMYALFEGTTIHAKGGADYLYGNSYTDNIYGGAGVDYIYGYGGADNLYGENDGDTLYGGEGDDTLNGGAGNDSLDGESGNDKYVFDVGFGTDVISDSQGTNRIVFTSDVTLEDLSIVRDTSSTNDLRIIVEGCNDTIRLRYANSTPVYRNFEFQFANGSVFMLTMTGNNFYLTPIASISALSLTGGGLNDVDIPPIDIMLPEEQETEELPERISDEIQR